MRIEVSLADALDRLTILEIKLKRISNPEKLAEIQKEIESLHELIPLKTRYAFHYGLLMVTNERVWEYMDVVNATPTESRHTVEFAQIADKVYDYNDQRFRIKRLINTLENSTLKEQKSYELQTAIVTVKDVYHCIPVINYLSLRYDTVTFHSESMDILKSLFTTPNFVYDQKVVGVSIDADTFQLERRSDYEFPPITYLASGQLGDFIHSLSVVNEKYKETGRKGLVYMTEYPGPDNSWTFFHRGVKETYNDVYPFLKQQSYIHDVLIHSGESCEYNLAQWRMNFSVYEGWNSIYGRNYGIEWSKSAWFISDFDEKYSNTVFITTTPRRWWIEPFDMHKLISKLGPDVRFLASEMSNYEHFHEKTGIDLPVVFVESFTDVVRVIASCKILVGTLSAHISIADALHKKRIAMQRGVDHEMASRTNPSFLTPYCDLDNSSLLEQI